MAPNFCASKKASQKVGHRRRAQMDIAISMICALRPTFMKSTSSLLLLCLWFALVSFRLAILAERKPVKRRNNKKVTNKQ